MFFVLTKVKNKDVLIFVSYFFVEAGKLLGAAFTLFPEKSGSFLELVFRLSK